MFKDERATISTLVPPEGVTGGPGEHFRYELEVHRTFLPLSMSKDVLQASLQIFMFHMLSVYSKYIQTETL